MDTIRIRGGIALQGKVRIQGSKNAALPVLAATILSSEASVVENCPKIADVQAMLSLLERLGCRVTRRGSGLVVDPAGFQCGAVCSDAVKGMRSSVFLLGAMLGKCGRVVMEYPGGCVIGSRPIDLHIAALSQMGARFQEKEGLLSAEAEGLHGARITLPKPSVGATENVILAAVMAEGTTVLDGAAREPEIAALCAYLQACGAVIDGIGGTHLEIQGGRALYGADFRIPADRIVAGTYLMAAVGTGGNVFLEEAPAKELEAVTEVAVRMGAKLCAADNGIYVQGPERMTAAGHIVTAPYPGFATDLQSPTLAALTLADGETLIEETLFENRFRVAGALREMGASLEQLSREKLLVRGVPALRGARVTARELRGGAALTVAGLMAGGNTEISGCRYIYRGYENICRDFRELGARIISV